jgi:hypothetical protein
MNQLAAVGLNERLGILPYEKFSHLYKSLKFVRVLKSRRIRPVGYAARTERQTVHKAF